MARGASTRRELPFAPAGVANRRAAGRRGDPDLWEKRLEGACVGLPVALVNAPWAAPDSNPIFVAVVGALLATSATSSRARSSPGSRCGAGCGRRLLHRRARFRPFSTARNALHPSRPHLAVALRPRGSGRARRGSRCARILVRAVRLARVDFIHVLGGLATLAIDRVLTQASLFLSFASSQRTRESPPQRSLRSSCRRSCFSPRSCTSTRPLD